MECAMLELLVYILVGAIVLGLLFYVITLIPLPPPFALIVRLVFALIVILVIAYTFVPILARGPHY
jgi:hypothetical protein